MIISRGLLLSKLKSVLGGLNKEDSLSQGTDNFLFHGNKLSSYNNNVSITVLTNDVFDNTEINACIHGNEFYDVLSKFDTNTINFEINDKTITITSGEAKVEMALIDSSSYNLLVENIKYKEEDFTDLPDNFINIASNCLMNDKSMYSGLFVKDSGVFTTDAHILNYGELNGEIPSFFISNDSVLKLLKLNETFKYIQVSNSWVHFKSDNIVFSAKRLNDELFPYDKVLKWVVETKKDIVCSNYEIKGIFPNNVFSSLERSINFASYSQNENNVIEMTISDGNVKIFSKKLLGNYVENIKCEEIDTSGKTIKLYVNAKRLIDMKNKPNSFYIFNKMIFALETDSTLHIIATRMEQI